VDYDRINYLKGEKLKKKDVRREKLPDKNWQ
jgi:hypothetical protein